MYCTHTQCARAHIDAYKRKLTHVVSQGQKLSTSCSEGKPPALEPMVGLLHVEWVSDLRLLRYASSCFLCNGRLPGKSIAPSFHPGHCLSDQSNIWTMYANFNWHNGQVDDCLRIVSAQWEHRHLCPHGMTACVRPSVKQITQELSSGAGLRLGSEDDAFSFWHARLWFSVRLPVIPRGGE